MKYFIALMILGLQLSVTGLQAFHYGSDPVGNAKVEPRNEELEERSEVK
jgi:hypothetical protein